MAIWLKKASSAIGDVEAEKLIARVGADSDVLRRETFGELIAIDDAYAALAAERDAVMAAACDEAARIVESGSTEAREIVDAAQREYAASSELGYRDGFDRALGEWTERLAIAADAQNRLQISMRERLASIVTSAVEQIVRVERHEALFERALATVDRIVDGATYLRVAVHPDDHNEAKAAFEGLAVRWRDLGRPIPLSVVADKRLGPGCCVCETDFGIVDAGLETQLRAMRSAVSRALKCSVEEAASTIEFASFAESNGAMDEAGGGEHHHHNGEAG